MDIMMMNLLNDILSELQDINEKLDNMNNKLGDISGSGINSMDDICNKIESLETTIEFKD